MIILTTERDCGELHAADKYWQFKHDINGDFHNSTCGLLESKLTTIVFCHIV